ncbi:MAG: 3-deoxy-D-manno-octulosonic acid kinase [Pseudomonadota bacterium]|nr:3-deoxy-D-manno-octulosonic acid kinase [Pseudomonadota bacterium]
MVESEVCVRDQGAVMLVHPVYQHRVSVDWFSPGFWGACATPVSSGGRGGAWFVEADADHLVLREYLRGGWMSMVARRTYIYTGESKVRSFSEFRLLHQLTNMGLPVPRPVAAFYSRLSPVQYRAAIIIERLEGTVPLAELIPTLSQHGWVALGATIRRFHDAGVMHADLNCFNVLVRNDEYFLIDFDKGQLVEAHADDGWKARNLERFSRSLVKLGGEEARKRVWNSFMNGYNRGMAT